MAMRDLASWLISNRGFQEKLKLLTVASVGGQFGLVSTYENAFSAGSEVGYFLMCASILAHSSDGRCQDAALRIAQFCLSDPRVKNHHRDGAALVLDALVNQTAIRLAEARNLLPEGYEERLPLRALIETTNRKIEYSINLAQERKIRVNKFQALFWEGANSSSWLSVSAPTSAGKSFILETWIQDFLARESTQLIVYVVPTRALISEVELDLKARLDPIGSADINVASLPLAKSYKPDHSNVFVFTQERLHIFLNSFAEPPKVDVLLVDEAHKIGDSYRGAFLQQVIENVAELNPNVKVIFASPFTSNPELLLDDAPSAGTRSIVSSDVTVNQNLIWVTQKPRRPKLWSLSLCLAKELVPLGDFSLPNTPSPDSKRLPFVALALSMGKPGSIVYVNGAADAERTALQLFDSLPEVKHFDTDVAALIELCEKTVHKRFLLARTLERGVAFHYGNMPLLVKGEVERLFSLNKISFLICTSTLVEGVNMSCKNIFMRGPKKGRTSLMKADDFWNLAGRAGRWGKEFQGNIFCVDADNAALWSGGEPPRTKSGVHIVRTTDEVIGRINELIDYIESDEHLKISNAKPELEHVFSYLAALYLRRGSLVGVSYLKRQNPESIEMLQGALAKALAGITVPVELLQRNPGISPLLMQSLLNRFSRPSESPVERFLLAEPSSADALHSYTTAFTRIAEHLSPKLGFTSKQAYVRALLVVRWMRGFPLARLIQDRIDFLKGKDSSSSEATVIREVMKEVEEIARYQAPRLLACYTDVLRHFLETIGRDDLASELHDLSVFLELGLNQLTQISLVGMGLSRTAAVMLSEIIAKDSLTESQCLNWLLLNEWQVSDLPKLVIQETEIALERARRKSELS